ncbi:hypothetical protein A9Q84_10295 [Halobacteriovorax marinus]|uniref:Thioredoxin domain-containing protein n=1 Tax=Halobacteriovorax marinus TaxID=97084 RepID=A0A1Y5FDQ0_9BACT|nr:hypothetical protein A9Q84_10295 [Halobacteriovorax marinus]
MGKYLLVFLIPLMLSNKFYSPKEFSLKVFAEDREVTLASLKGKKTIINFWATWCTSCIKELPILNRLKLDPKASEYRFLAISAGDSKKKIRRFLKRNKFNYTVLMDKSRKVSKSWGVELLPVTIVLDETGKVIYSENIPPLALP